MSILKLLPYHHKMLREVAVQVHTFDEQLRHTIQNLFATLYQEQAVGLAAPQVGIGQRIFVIDVSDNQTEARCFINPEIVEKEGETFSDEGCLSVPGAYIRVKRAQRITVRYHDEYGIQQSLTTDGLTANCIQHELDHLNGILFIDYLSKLKRSLVLKKVEKLQRLAS